MKLQLIILLIFYVLINLISNVTSNETEKVVVCYYGTWATYRNGNGKFDTSDINPDLCTHVIYTFVGINEQGTVISLDPYLDYAENYGRDNFNKFNSLKNLNPNLKTLLAVGGYNEGSAKYSNMAADATLRKNFIDSAKQMILKYGFNGLDIDWEYPGQRDTVHGSADVENFSTLLKELKEEFQKDDLLITIAVAAVEKSAALSYDIPTVSLYVDYIHLMSFDFHGSWDGVTGHNAGLFKSASEQNVTQNEEYTVEAAVLYWLNQGCPPEKLVVGMPFYGRTFYLSSPSSNGVGAPITGAGMSGPYTGTPGFLGYNEFCENKLSDPWDIHQDSLAMVPYAVNGRNWLSFDDQLSLETKVQFSLEYNLAGAMVWSIETDDLHAICGNGDFPLLRTINKALGRLDGGNASALSTSTLSTARSPVQSSTATSTSTTSSSTPTTSNTKKTTITTTTTKITTAASTTWKYTSTITITTRATTPTTTTSTSNSTTTTTAKTTTGTSTTWTSYSTTTWTTQKTTPTTTTSTSNSITTTLTDTITPTSTTWIINSTTTTSAKTTTPTTTTLTSDLINTITTNTTTATTTTLTSDSTTTKTTKKTTPTNTDSTSTSTTITTTKTTTPTSTNSTSYSTTTTTQKKTSPTTTDSTSASTTITTANTATPNSTNGTSNSTTTTTTRKTTPTTTTTTSNTTNTTTTKEITPTSKTWIYNATTDTTTGKTTPTTSTSVSNSTTASASIIRTLCDSEGFVPHPYDCSSFYRCVRTIDGGFEPTLFDCPPTTLWDQTVLTCNYADQVTCSNSTMPTTAVM